MIDYVQPRRGYNECVKSVCNFLKHFVCSSFFVVESKVNECFIFSNAHEVSVPKNTTVTQ
jgi:hypothetical protein